jgi:hypothetical protein
MAFNNEFKVEFEQWARSLQDMLKSLEARVAQDLIDAKKNSSDIANNTKAIAINTKRIKDLRAKADAGFSDCLNKLTNIKISDAGGSTTSSFFQGELGQIGKVSVTPSKIFPHDNFQIRHVSEGLPSQDVIANIGGSSDPFVYDIKNDKLYFCKDGASYLTANSIGPDVLTPRVFYFNPISKLFVFYRFRANYDILSASNASANNDLGVITTI